MILRSFASNQPYTLIMVPILVLLSVLPMAWGSAPIPVVSGFPSDELFRFVYLNSTTLAVTTSVLILSGAILANLIFNKHEFYNIPVFVPALMYAVTAVAISMIQLSLPVLLANVFLLAGLNKQLRIFRQTRVLGEYFESGFWFGMAAVCFPPYLTLAFGLWMTTIVTRAFHWREHLLPLVAFSVPFLYWLTWKYWNSQWDDIVLFRKVISFDVNSFFHEMKWGQGLYLIVTVIVVILALPRYIFLSDRASNKARSVKNVFLIMSVAMMAAFILGYFLVMKWILMTALLPVAFIAGYWFTNYRYSLIAPFAFYTYCAAATIVVLEYYRLLP
jgi:hypothetical protein